MTDEPNADGHPTDRWLTDDGRRYECPFCGKKTAAPTLDRLGFHIVRDHWQVIKLASDESVEPIRQAVEDDTPRELSEESAARVEQSRREIERGEVVPFDDL